MIKTAVTQTSLGPMGGQESIDPVGGDNITMVVVVNRRTSAATLLYPKPEVESRSCLDAFWRQGMQ